LQFFVLRAELRGRGAVGSRVEGAYARRAQHIRLIIITEDIMYSGRVMCGVRGRVVDECEERGEGPRWGFGGDVGFGLALNGLGGVVSKGRRSQRSLGGWGWFYSGGRWRGRDGAVDLRCG